MDGSLLLNPLMVGHGESSAGSYLTDPTSPIPSHCAVIIVFKVFQCINCRDKLFVRVNIDGNYHCLIKNGYLFSQSIQGTHGYFYIHRTHGY